MSAATVTVDQLRSILEALPPGPAPPDCEIEIWTPVAGSDLLSNDAMVTVRALGRVQRIYYVDPRGNRKAVA